MECPNCHYTNPPGARFCSNCGNVLVEPRAIEGERRFATILFADVVDSTSLAEQLDPEEWTEIMQGAFGFMNAAVSEFGGTVARLMGDAVLALFGAPVAHEDDAERAVRAALRIQDRASAYGARLRADHGLEFAVRVGINTGLAVLARVGDDNRSEYTAMGDAANLAARLQTLAAPGSILVGEDTYALVKHAVDASSVGTLRVKGRNAPVSAYRVAGLRAVPGKQRGLEGISSPLVGREGELRQLTQALDSLALGRGQLIAIVGEAGLGKSRLTAELRGLARQRFGPRIRWFEGRGLSYARSTVYFPWQQILRQAIGARDEDQPEHVRTALLRFAETRAVAQSSLPFLEKLLGVGGPDADSVLAGLEGDALIDGITSALDDFLKALSDTAPTVVVFEDLHWSDRPTVDALLRTAEAVSRDRLLVICVTRPDGDEESASRVLLESLKAQPPTWFSEIVLAPLDAAGSKTLLANLLFIEDLPAAVREMILAKSDGNPFFIEEVIRSLIDSGHVLQEPDGHWRASPDIGDVAIPDTLVGVLSARIDRLPEVARNVAQTAAVIGRTFPHRVLKEVCAEAPPPERIDDVDPHLETLTREDLLRERTREPELEYAFKHALTQEAAYERLLLKRRRTLHRRTATVLQRIYGDSEDHAALLAFHSLNGGDWATGARHSLRAARLARGVYALDDAFRHFQSAVEALERLPEVRPDEFIDAVLEWIDAAVAVRRHERLEPRQDMLARLESAERSARALGDRRRLAQVLVSKGNVLSLSGFPGEGFPSLLEANEMADELGDESLFLLPYFAMTEKLLDLDPRAALEQFDNVIALARKHRNYGIEAHSLAVKAIAHVRLGQFAEGRAAMAQALEVVPRSRSLIKEADVNIYAGGLHYELGDIEEGIRHSLIGVEKALAANGLECACAGYFYTGIGRYRADRLEEALQDFTAAETLGSNISNLMDPFNNLVHAGQAMVKIATGEAQAIRGLEEALANARKLGDEYGAALIDHALGDARTRLGDAGAGRRHLEDALAYYRRNGMQPYIARVLRSLAVNLETEGRPAEAEPLRERAAEIDAAIIEGAVPDASVNQPAEVVAPPEP